MKVIDQFSNDGIGCKTCVKFVLSHCLVLIRLDCYSTLFEFCLLLVKLSWSGAGWFVGFVYIVDKVFGKVSVVDDLC